MTLTLLELMILHQTLSDTIKFTDCSGGAAFSHDDVTRRRVFKDISVRMHEINLPVEGVEGD